MTDEIFMQALEQAGISGENAAMLKRSFVELGLLSRDLQRTSLNTTLMIEGSLMGGSEATVSTPENDVSADQASKYDQQGILAMGGMGEVHQVFDKTLKRSLAMKVIHSTLNRNNSIVMRFVEEAQVVAQLQHPNIVPVHEIGVLADGRRYFTMKKIEGESFDKQITNVHNAVRENEWFPTVEGWSFRRLLSTFLEICEAISYAHSKGVIHRDIKPENIMIGAFGEVLVVDWGIAKILGGVPDDELIVTERSELNAFQTRMGQVAGTPAYMAPEQAAGLVDLIDARTDIYALGALLYEILSGKPPYSEGAGEDILQQVRTRSPLPLAELRSIPFEEELEVEYHRHQDFSRHQEQAKNGPPIPLELILICEKAMARSIADRFESTVDLAQGVRDWLDGAQKHEQAMIVIAKAKRLRIDASVLEEKRQRLQAELTDITLLGWASLSEKRAYWAKEQQISELESEHESLEAEQEYLFRAAFTHKPNMVAAHRGLAHLYRKWHQQAERNNNRRDRLRFEHALERHVRALPAIGQESFLHYLQGKGTLTVHTGPSEATVVLERYQLVDHRLEATSLGMIGRTPLHHIALDMGSYRLRIKAPNHAEMLLPFEISRGCDVQQGSVQAPLLLLGQEDSGECYVPAGYTWIGGDPEALNGLPQKRVWIDAFVMTRFPVTNREYLAFLNGLLQRGEKESAWQYAPKKGSDQLYESLYSFSQDEQCFSLPDDEDSVLYGWDRPVCFIDWHCANAYAAWLSEQTAQNWRLPRELEWEKAARGTDRRIYSWGNRFDASFCCMADSQEEASPCDIWDYPIDESPYGVRHMAGNMSEWTASAWNPYGPDIVGGQIVSAAEDPEDDRVIRGGYWEDYPRRLRLACRDDGAVVFRDNYLGFRLLRSV